MMKQKLLFVCTANLQRSPTAENLVKNSDKYKAKSAGTNILSEKPINSQSIKWADKIIVMERNHKKIILKIYPEAKNKEIMVLDIPDIYIKNDPKLIRILKNKLKEKGIEI